MLVKFSSETVTDYVFRAETAAAALKNCGENITDSLLIVMVLKGLPESFKPFVVVVTQSDSKQSFTEFKAALRSFEDTENVKSVNDDSVMRLRMSNVSVSSPSRLSNKVGRKIPPLVFTSGIFRYFPAWQIRLKWQIMANITFCREILANMILSCKMQQLSLRS